MGNHCLNLALVTKNYFGINHSDILNNELSFKLLSYYQINLVFCNKDKQHIVPHNIY
ncbi:hypothetical protein GCM10009131_04380 [Morganella psychrotolerans]